LLIAAGALLGLGVWTPWSQRYVQGVDVSRHQGPIDWPTLASSGVRFSYIKATEGTDYVDPRFAANWADAARAGVYRGAYHFFTLCRPGSAQADHFIRTVPRTQGALPPAVDLEHMGPCRRGPTFTNVNDNVRDYLDIVERHYGVRPILYVTREFHDAHLKNIQGERFWVRSLFVEPRFRQRDWVIWQHHPHARRPGVSKPIDLNSFRGDEAALAALAGEAVSGAVERTAVR
jgi:lysozyme